MNHARLSFLLCGLGPPMDSFAIAQTFLSDRGTCVGPVCGISGSAVLILDLRVGNLSGVLVQYCSHLVKKRFMAGGKHPDPARPHKRFKV
jgi:hypothetical protein